MAANDRRVSDIVRPATRYAFAAIVCLGLMWHFGWRPSFRLEGQDLLWFVAYWVIAVPLLVVEDRIRKRIGPHQGFELAVVIVRDTIIVVGSVGLALVVLWMAGTL